MGVACLMGAACVAPANDAVPKSKPADKIATAPTKPARVNAPEKSVAKPTTRPGDLSPAAASAVETLVKEYQAVLKSPDTITPRLQSDYFTKTGPALLAVADVLASMEKRLDSNPSVDAYVKWQLLSALPTQLDETVTKDFLRVYKRIGSQRLPVRPGSNGAEASRLASGVMRIKEADVGAENQQWQNQLKRHGLLVDPVLQLRDGLYSRLSKTPDVLAIAMEDAALRVSAGYNASGFTASVFNDVRSTAAGLKRNEIARLGGMVQRFGGVQGPRVFDSIVFDDKKKVAGWKTSDTKIDRAAVDSLVADLSQMAKSGF